MTPSIVRLSRVMRISWQIQKRRRQTRSMALTAAWAICNNEEITVEFLTQKLNRSKPLPKRALDQFALFS